MNLDSNHKDNLYYQNEETGIKDYLILIRQNFLLIILMALAGLAVAVVYAYNTQDIYSTNTLLQLTAEKQNILEGGLFPEFQTFGNDRFIANEIKIASSQSTRNKVAENLIDSVSGDNLKNYYRLVYREEEESPPILKTRDEIAKLLKSVAIEQERGLDILVLRAESPSPVEAALIANTYASSYKDINLQNNRTQLIVVKNFLAKQRNEKLDQLQQAEENLRIYKEDRGIVRLENQTESLIAQLTEFDSKLNAEQVELSITEKIIEGLKQNLSSKSSEVETYMETYKIEPYIKGIQTQIAEWELQKDRALACDNEIPEAERQRLINEADEKIRQLSQKLDNQLKEYKLGMLAVTPEEYRSIAQNIIEEEIKASSLRASIEVLQNIVTRLEARFNKLPQRIIEVARLERERAAFEKLYLLIEEKYQEALINEQSTPGNVLIVDRAFIPSTPSKPNRIMIILIGLVIGLALGVGYVITKNYFDTSIKTPEDIQNLGINVLAWIPQIEAFDKNTGMEFVVAKRPDSIPAEAFRALRTRVQFSKLELKDKPRTILVTSSVPKEGKTLVSVNLAGSFAQAGKKVVIVDCDLRKPRLHNVMTVQKAPGFTDYVFGNVSFEQIVRKSELENLDFITAGMIPPNPSEILGSSQMDNFLSKLREKYDLVVLDSPPVTAVTDSEILSRIVDSAILVVSANNTDKDLMQKAVGLLEHDRRTFIGVLLNNFNYRSGYSSYYKYYYYYSSEKKTKESPKV